MKNLEPDESAFTFPTPFTLKVMGNNAPDFAELVLSLVRRHVPELPPEAAELRPSRDGRFLSVTLRFTAQSKAQLNAIYQDLSREKRVLMAL